MCVSMYNSFSNRVTKRGADVLVSFIHPVGEVLLKISFHTLKLHNIVCIYMYIFSYIQFILCFCLSQRMCHHVRLGSNLVRIQPSKPDVPR